MMLVLFCFRGLFKYNGCIFKGGLDMIIFSGLILVDL